MSFADLFFSHMLLHLFVLLISYPYLTYFALFACKVIFAPSLTDTPSRTY